MSLLTSLVSAFKGGGGARVPVSRGVVSPWSHWGATAFDGGPPGRSPFDYAREVGEAYLANPVAQRAVRIVAEGVGSAPIACANEQLEALIRCSCGAQPLLEVLAAQLSLHGNAYVQIVKDGAGVPVELYPLRPERVQALVTGNSYNIQDIARAMEPAAPEVEAALWYQYYFHSERGRRGLTENRRDLIRHCWSLWSPKWGFDDAIFAQSAAAFDNPDFVDVVIHSYRHRYGLVPGDPAVAYIETQLTAQPPPATKGGCVVVSKPLLLLDLLEQVKTRQTEPRQGTASEPAEPRQSTPGEVAEPSQATLSARTTTAAAKPPHSRRRRLCCCSCRECCLAWLCHLAWSALPWLGWLACCALPRLGLPCLDLL